MQLKLTDVKVGTLTFGTEDEPLVFDEDANLNVLIGMNGSGKTAVMYLQWLVRASLYTFKALYVLNGLKEEAIEPALQATSEQLKELLSPPFE